MMELHSIRIVFMGTPEFACAPLKALIEDGYTIVAVVSQPDKPVGRKKVLEPTATKKVAMEHGIPVVQPLSINENYDDVLAYRPDLVITCAYGQKVPNALLEYPKYGCINLHGSLLPKYRGGAPIQRAIMDGQTITGMTLMEMVERMDAGKMYSVEKVDIDPDDTYDSLSLKMMDACQTIIHRDIPLYLDGKLEGIPQDESKRSLAFTIKKETEKVSFHDETIDALYDHMRGLIDHPAPYTYFGDKKVKFHEIRKEKKDHRFPLGQAIKCPDHFKIAANGGFIHVYSCQMEGKSRLDGISFFNGIVNKVDTTVFD